MNKGHIFTWFYRDLKINLYVSLIECQHVISYIIFNIKLLHIIMFIYFSRIYISSACLHEITLLSYMSFNNSSVPSHSTNIIKNKLIVISYNYNFILP